MLEYGIIEPAASPWASNVVLVKKKDGSLRFCVDYRRLNSITYKDSYPLPLIDNCLNALSGSSWYSMLESPVGILQYPDSRVRQGQVRLHHPPGLFPFHCDAIRAHLRAFRFPAAHGRGIMRTVLSSMSGLPRRYHRLWEDLRRAAGATRRSFRSPESRQLEA